MDGIYQLINSFHAHDGPIRSVAIGPNNEILTGSQSDSPCLRRWSVKLGDDTVEEIGTPLYHDHWVTAVTSLGINGSRLFHPKGCIITGCMDTKIRVFSNEGLILNTLEGHSKGVISFSWTSTGLLVSGSWDGTAKIWNLETNVCVQSLENHENGVHVLGLENGLIATTSTGESVDGKPANFKLRIWDPATGRLVGSPIADHTGSIRAITALRGVGGFATGANDGTVSLRSVDGEVLGTVFHAAQEDGSAPFILDCCALNSDPDSGSMEVVSCGEDGSVAVWSGTEIVQSIPHPTSVWCVLAIPSAASGAEGDFLTAGHDGVLRFFSRDVERLNKSTTAPQMTHDFLAEVVEAAQKKRKGPSADELAKAPRWELRGQHNGTSDNQVMVFNRDGTMIAAQWISSAWVVIGEVTGSGDGGYIGDVWFDHVMPVEIETSTGLRTLKLGHNNGENPFLAAQRFIETNSLEKTYLGQIADWVMSRSGQTVPTLGAAGGVNSAQYQQQNIPPPAPRSTFSFKLVAYTTFEDIPQASKLFAKLVELAETQGSVRLTESELLLVNGTLSILCDTSHYHSSTLSVEQLKAVSKMSTQWDSSTVFPAYDILRLVAVHPNGAEVLANLLTTTGGTIVRSALDLLTRTDGSVPHAASITASRFLCNALKNSALRNVVVGNYFRELLDVISILAQHTNKSVRLSAASIAMNCSVIVSSSGTSEVRSALVAVSASLIRGEKESSDIIFRALKTLGTVLITTPVAEKAAVFGSLDISTLLHQLAREWSVEKLGDAAFKCLHEVLLIST